MSKAQPPVPKRGPLVVDLPDLQPFSDSQSGDDQGDRNDEQSPGEDPFISLPVIFDIEGTPRIFFVAWYIRDANGTGRQHV